MFQKKYKEEVEEVVMDPSYAVHLVEQMTEGGEQRIRRPVRAVLLAVAACLVLSMSALAVFPALRQQLEVALGGYIDYAQSIQGVTAVENGVEFQVLSAVADGSMVRVYVQVRDLAGNRLSADMSVNGVVERQNPADVPENEGQSFGTGGTCVGFDQETGQALLAFSTWGSIPSDLGQMGLKILHLRSGGWGGEDLLTDEVVELPITVEVLPSREIPLAEQVSGMELQSLRLSVLGVTLLSGGQSNPGMHPVTLYLGDGTVAHTRFGGQGGFGRGDGRWLTCWELDTPVEPDEVTAVSIGYWCIPVEGETAGQGYWLEKLPD